MARTKTTSYKAIQSHTEPFNQYHVSNPVFIVPVGALAAARPSPQHPDKSRPARRYAPARPLNRAVVTGHCSGGGIV
ncbi:hypothetical protein ICJ11_003964 [Escherichia coli]|uniref:hypothetical protein n=1 Tax=Enterobacteriaceae TaxID=543 RepID=UPI0013C34F44|nr:MULTISPECIES: hypothetical protein [Enterobacteriaceae]EGF5852557.1 hypothetical protein [Escherichia coli]MDC3530728.1 hypothetical protein [Escherichia coli]UGF55868.1 hypothetical protein LQQ60_24055 [Escherichia coli]HAN5103951.1 hypothetical protein [Escherichia coli]HAX1992305.1 hypothetical protein [Escherichia coli]